MKRHALFVGIDDYADPTIQNLDFPSEDAGELASVFRRLLKFDRVEKLVNPAHAPDVVDAVKGMTRGLGPGDLFLFFFAGHGFRVRENHVLVCAKDEYADLEDEDAGLPVGQLKRRMRGPWNRMLVLDACQNDIRATRGADAGVTSRDLELIHAVEDGGRDAGFQIVVTSCSEGQKALEVADLGHGLFTSAFLDSVTSFADARRRIDLESLRTDLGVRMGGLIDRYRLAGRQEPLFSMPANAAGIVLLDGAAPPPLVEIPVLVVCHKCGRRRNPLDTFRCPGCQRDFCLDHQDADTFLCPACADKARREDAERKVAEERARRERVEAERKEWQREELAKAKRKASEEAVRQAREWIGAQAGERKVIRVGSVDVPLRWCPPGTFTMGSPADESGRYDDETQHRVTLTKGFWMGETPVTNGLWKSIMGIYPEYKEELLEAAKEAGVEFIGDNCPACSVSWNDCQVFLRQLNAKVPSGWRFELPTEAQWEYACRAGTTGAYGGTGRLNDMGVCFEPELLFPTQLAVGQKTPNAWGLYDMHGNVGEWCADWYGLYSLGAVTDPTGPTSGSCRVIRGGSMALNARDCRSACRSFYHPERGLTSVGVRVAMVAPGDLLELETR